MRILNAIYQLKSQRSLLARAPGRHPVNGAHILSVTVLALLTSCTIELKPDKVPGGITGNNRQSPTYPTYPRPTPADPVQVYPGSLTSMDGGYGLGTQPASASANSRPTGDGFIIKITAR
jgi:hypothetical protein